MIRHHGEQQSAADLLEAERSRCLTQLNRLEQEFQGIIESGSGGTDDEHDPEGATLAYERQHVAALAGQVQQHLAEIDAAVGRLQDGSYGQCESCGQLIGAARLTARPMATTCVGCARRR